MNRAADMIRVLHVDDDPNLSDTVAAFLERANSRFDITTATSADEGWDQLSTNEFDCIVSGYDIPEQNGIEFLETIRQEYPDLPYILYTGKGSEEVASEAISKGVTDYLQKETGTSQYDILTNRIINAVNQRRSHRDAAETERRLQTLAEKTNDILWMFTADWSELLFINSTYEEVWGRSIDGLKERPQSFLEGIHPDDRPTVKEAMERLSGGESVDLEFRVNADEDFKWWVWVEGEPIFDDSGGVKKVVGFGRDITEKKEREQELKAVRERMEFGLKSTDSFVWDWNVDEDQASFYPAEEELYGATVESLDDFVELIHPEDRQEVQESIERAVETGEPKDEEIRILRDEEVRWLDAPGQLIQDADGTTRMIGVVRDITEKKRREQEIERQNQRLDEFASVVSHDLRSPLAVAQGHLDLLREERESPHVEEVSGALDRMHSIIEDTLTLARAGQAVGETATVDLSALANGCWRTVEAGDATLTIEETMRIHADEDRLRHLFENLFRNAIDHGGEDVTIRVGWLEDAAGFYAEDDGPGIPEDDRDQVFESGYSGSSEGTGFGLRIVKTITEAHGWEIYVTDSEDGGARFEITGVEVIDE